MFRFFLSFFFFLRQRFNNSVSDWPKSDIDIFQPIRTQDVCWCFKEDSCLCSLHEKYMNIKDAFTRTSMCTGRNVEEHLPTGGQTLVTVVLNAYFLHVATS